MDGKDEIYNTKFDGAIGIVVGNEGEGRMMDKQKALETALLQIEKQYGKGSIMRLGATDAVVDVPVVSTGSMALDLALGIYGLPLGRIVEIFGPESAGKTTVALHIIAETQKIGADVAAKGAG